MFSCRRCLGTTGFKFVNFFTFSFSAIVSRIAITFACTKYGDDMSQNRRYLMQRSLSTTCWSDAHSAHIATVTLPAIILYLIVCPLFLTLVKRNCFWFFIHWIRFLISFFRSSRFFLFFFAKDSYSSEASKSFIC